MQMVELQVLLVLQHLQDLILVFKLQHMIILLVLLQLQLIKFMDLHLERPNTVKLKGLEFRCPKTVVGTPTNATYNPATGVLVLTIANHGLVNGDAVVLDTGSICFTCDKDSNNTTHCYPRATDPAAGQYLTISNRTTNTFRVNVGASAPSDQYVHTFVSAAADSVKTIGGGGYVGVTTTIFQDHERPLFVVGIVSDRTFEVQAGASTIPHTYQGGGHAFEFFEDLNIWFRISWWICCYSCYRPSI